MSDFQDDMDEWLKDTPTQELADALENENTVSKWTGQWLDDLSSNRSCFVEDMGRAIKRRLKEQQ